MSTRKAKYLSPFRAHSSQFSTASTRNGACFIDHLDWKYRLDKSSKQLHRFRYMSCCARKGQKYFTFLVDILNLIQVLRNRPRKYLPVAATGMLRLEPDVEAVFTQPIADSRPLATMPWVMVPVLDSRANEPLTWCEESQDVRFLRDESAGIRKYTCLLVYCEIVCGDAEFSGLGWYNADVPRVFAAVVVPVVGPSISGVKSA